MQPSWGPCWLLASKRALQQFPLSPQALEDKATLTASWLTALHCFLFHPKRTQRTEEDTGSLGKLACPLTSSLYKVLVCPMPNSRSSPHPSHQPGLLLAQGITASSVPSQKALHSEWTLTSSKSRQMPEACNIISATWSWIFLLPALGIEPRVSH